MSESVLVFKEMSFIYFFIGKLNITEIGEQQGT